MFSFIVIGWAMFRAPSMTWLINVAFNSPFLPSHNEFILGLIALTMTLAYFVPLFIKYLLDRYAPDGWAQAAFFAIAMTLVILYINSASSDFIYFQF
jgi:hypothetical protein